MAKERLRTIKAPRSSGRVTRAQMRDIFLRMKEGGAGAPEGSSAGKVRERAADTYGRDGGTKD